MAVREIRQLGNPILWKRSETVGDAVASETASIIRDLDDTLAEFRRANGYGRGIAAPQIGVLKRVIFIHVPDGTFCGPLINPQIMWRDERSIELWDACFSFPDLMVKVSRAAAIEVRYMDEKGQSRVIKADGDLSELLQHEIDHLDGILAIDRAVSPTAFSTRTEWQQRHGDRS